MEWYDSHGGNARRTCRNFGISPDTFYRWRRRYNPRDPSSLENRGDRRRRSPRPIWTLELESEVLGLRKKYPRRGKDKLVRLLRRRGWGLSAFTVGRILADLKRRGLLRDSEPSSSKLGVAGQVHYAEPKPDNYQVIAPGDLVEIEIEDLRTDPGVLLKQFKARDVVS